MVDARASALAAFWQYSGGWGVLGWGWRVCGFVWGWWCVGLWWLWFFFCFWLFVFYL
ncbi:hypothetical protein RA267_27960 [Pseudomonas syringae pv. tagetis]|uniref:hypothetical protein n=1 Tax=Pseudomonas syringae group genomosp. 7 TaxID=251699 RepID=UPI0037701995